MLVKGINNRQKSIVKPRESIQKYLSQQKNLQKSLATGRRGFKQKNSAKREK